MIRVFLSILLRFLYILVGYIIVLPLCIWSILRGESNFPKWAYYYDNEEDGFDGDKRGWYSGYKEFNIREKSKMYRIWSAYGWSAWRNPAWNLRFHPFISVDVTKQEHIEFEGNTYHHGIKYSFNPENLGKKYYKIKTIFEGREFESNFKLIPLWGDTYLYFRYGLKIYPAYYLDEYWLKRIDKNGWPPHKDRGLYAISIRFRSLDKL